MKLQAHKIKIKPEKDNFSQRHFEKQKLKPTPAEKFLKV
tara:strand:- start:233 stop:349 length:117 start_codon:yes stop_codon:yes gene_type:complete